MKFINLSNSGASLPEINYFLCQYNSWAYSIFTLDEAEKQFIYDSETIDCNNKLFAQYCELIVSLYHTDSFEMIESVLKIASYGHNCVIEELVKPETGVPF